MTTKDTPEEIAAGAEAEYERQIKELAGWDAPFDASQIAAFWNVFPAFSDKEYERVRRRFLRNGVPLDQTDDLLQETFLELIKHVLARGAKEGLRRNLNMIAKTQFLMHMRIRRGAPVTIEIPSSGSAFPESEPDLARAIDYREAVRDCLPLLEPALRAAVQKCVLEDKDDAEAAAELGIPEGTLKSRLRKALAVLRQVLAQKFPHLQRKSA